ncbi:MAG: molybdopterin-binding/glycosyltransferase family 2 protein [Rhodospirillaceae bacterium]|nr:molybdopterin-binding/glycosyltransferase family 2 protein [Rhodospirillaceae bacterium]
MKFGTFALAEALGVILAHTLRRDGLTLKKGRVIGPDDIAALQRQGVASVIGAKLEAGDVPEDAAAAHIAKHLAGAGVTLSEARTGRCNLEATADGIVLVDAAAVDAANAIDEAATIATLADKTAVGAGQTIATVKIIPFAVSAASMAKLDAALANPPVRFVPYRAKRCALINTVLPGLKESVIASTTEITRERLRHVGASLDTVARCAHDTGGIAAEIKQALAARAEIVLIAGASATVDRGDVGPAAIVAAGGVIEHFGMPVDPGNLLAIGRIGQAHALVLPGCARSPKLNGLDWVLQRLAADIPVARRDIMNMGAGGLLVDTPARPLPRDQVVRAETPPHPHRIAILILAAGKSSRMGGDNKLLKAVDGVPLIRRTVMAALAAKPSDVVVVTGHEAEAVRAAVKGLAVRVVHNAHFAEGLSTSLKAGLDALAPDADAALVCLGDMPLLTPAHLSRLMAGFDPAGAREIVVPTHAGKRGNPVLWGRRFFAEMKTLAGDVGARHLIGAHEGLVCEMAFDDTAVVTDLDTPDQWRAFQAGAANR